MNKKPIGFGIALLAIMLAGSGSLAYKVTPTRTRNIITSGGVHIDLIQKQENKAGQIDEVDSITGKFVPGTQINGVISIENTGKSQAWVRLKADMKIQDEAGKELVNVLSDQKTPIITFTNSDLAEENAWRLGKDGYWYYLKPVNPKEETPSLISSLQMNPQAGNEYQRSTVNVNVQAQAVQVANNGSSVDKAVGWPEQSTGEENQK